MNKINFFASLYTIVHQKGLVYYLDTNTIFVRPGNSGHSQFNRR